MAVSLNCSILGHASNNIFNVPIGDVSDVNGVDVKFDNLTVANIKHILFNRRKVQEITTMDI